MGKNTGNDEAATSEGAIKPDLVFCDDALVVEYLNALLESEPALNMDFREIHVVHQDIRPWWSSSGMANAVGGTAMLLETEFSKMESDALRNENEKLKFKTELATIDAQVLRGENTNLKKEIAFLRTQLKEMKFTLQMALTQKDDLESRVEVSSNKRDRLSIDEEGTALYVGTDLVPPDEEKNVNKMDLDLESVASLDSRDIGNNHKQKPVSDSAILQETIAFEIAQKNEPDSVIEVQKYRMDDKTRVTTGLERSIISSVHAVNERENQKNKSDVAIFSRSTVVEKIPNQSAKLASKIIKQHHGAQQNGQVLQVSSLHTGQNAKYVDEANHTQDFVQQHSTTETEKKQADDLTLHKVAQTLDNADEINVETAPVPQNIIRRNVKNYEDLQKESDPTHIPAAGHTLVL